jgi:hypothetical protein
MGNAWPPVEVWGIFRTVRVAPAPAPADFHLSPSLPMAEHEIREMRLILAGFFEFLLDGPDRGGIVLVLKTFDLFLEAEDVCARELNERLCQNEVDLSLFFATIVIKLL